MANESGSNRPNRPMRPRQGGPGARRKRRVVIDNAAARPRDARQQQRDREAARPKQPREVAPVTGPVSVESGLTVRDLSQALGVPMPSIIKILMGLGQMRTATQSLSDEEVELIATEVGREITIKHAADEEEEPEEFDDPDDVLQARPPVVTEDEPELEALADAMEPDAESVGPSLPELEVTEVDSEAPADVAAAHGPEFAEAPAEEES